MKKLLPCVFLTLAFFLSFTQLNAQTTTTTAQGTIKDNKGEPIQGAVVNIKGTSLGTATDATGKYSIDIPAGATTLEVKYLGYKTQELDISKGIFDATLEEDAKVVGDVVVTALGIRREQKALGYATQKVDGEMLATAKDPNIVNSLQGKVAGVQISGNSDLGGSARITIRGIKSLTGNNQPLFVMDGIVIDNSSYLTYDETSGRLGYDYGNAAQDINPDDIEDLQVLKGSAATALYGSRGANGVILITSKKGTAHKGKGKSPIGVTFSEDVMFNTVSVLPKYQNTYGGGPSTDFLPEETDPTQTRVGMEYDQSWGPKMQGQLVRQWPSYYPSDTANYGKLTPFTAHPNNVKDFFRTGAAANTHLSFDGANDKGAFRLSFSNLNQTGTVPNSSLKRNSLSFNGSYNLTKKIYANVSATYVRDEGYGRPQVGFQSLFSNFTQWWQRQVDINELRNYKDPFDGSQRTWNLRPLGNGTAVPASWDNPFWTVYENYETDRRDRVFGRAEAGYKVLDWLTLSGSASTDYYQDFRDERVAVGSVVGISKYSQNTITYNESNYEFKVLAHHTFKQQFDISGFIGANRRENFLRNNYSQTQGGLNVPDLYTLLNSSGPIQVNNFESHYRQNSVYGDVSFGYRGLLFVNFTGRNDWSSSLPVKNSSYFYPSVSGSFVFSELVKKAKWFSLGKIRGGWSMTGNDTRAYSLQNTLLGSQSFGTNAIYVQPNVVNNPELKPERIFSWEVGADLAFFVDRIHVDFSYYNSITKDNIFTVQQSGASGSTYRIANAGVVANHGFEFAESFIPVKVKDFTWSIGFNLAKNTSKIKELYKDANGDDVGNIVLGTSVYAPVNIEARPGMAYGQIVGSDYVYDAHGNKMVDPNSGLYLTSPGVKPLGSILPDLTGGVSTTLSYKGLSLFVLFDYQKGGNVFSLTNTFGKYSGTLDITAANGVRENGVVAPGVLADGVDANGNPTSSGAKNTIVVPAQVFYAYNNNGYFIAKSDVYDASFVKLREIRLIYDLPAKLFSKSPIAGISLGFIGRNLAILKKNVPNIDPEAATNAGNLQGLEGGQKPSERSMGFTFKVRF